MTVAEETRPTGACPSCGREGTPASVTVRNPYVGKKFILASSLLGVPALAGAAAFGWFSHLTVASESGAWHERAIACLAVFSVAALLRGIGRLRHLWEAE